MKDQRFTLTGTMSQFCSQDHRSSLAPDQAPIRCPNIMNDPESYIFYSKKHLPHGTQQLDRRTARKMINKRCSDV